MNRGLGAAPESKDQIRMNVSFTSHDCGTPGPQSIQEQNAGVATSRPLLPSVDKRCLAPCLTPA